MTKKYRITIKTQKELMTSAEGLPMCEDGQWLLELEDGNFYECMSDYCGETLVAVKDESGYVFNPKKGGLSTVHFTLDMLSCEPELIEDEVGVWVQSYAAYGVFYNYIWLGDDLKKDYHSESESPLFPTEHTFISMKELNEFLQWKTLEKGE